MGQSLRAENLIGRHVNVEGVWLERARTAGGGEDGLGRHVVLRVQEA